MSWFGRCRAYATVSVGVSVVAAGLAGCSLIVPEPPATVSAAADSAVADVRSNPGIESVSVDVTLRDYQGEGSWSEPEAWIAHLTVNAEPGGRDLESAADEVVEALDDARWAVEMDAVLMVPQIDNEADAEIHFGERAREDGVAGERVRMARELAVVDGVRRVTVGSNDEYPRVEATRVDEWSEVAAGIRRIPGFGSGPLATATLVAPMASGESWSGDDSDRLRLDLGQVSPSPAMIEQVIDLATQSGVQSIALYSGEPVSTDDVLSAIRPSMVVYVETLDSAADLAEYFAELDDVALWPPGTGRPCYSIIPMEEGDGIESDVVLGCVGLPVGSPETDDVPIDLGDIAHSILF